MPNDTRLGVQITADDTAVAKIKELSTSLRAAQAQLEQFARSSTAASVAAQSAIQAYITSTTAQIEALKQQTQASEKVTATSAAQATAAKGVADATERAASANVAYAASAREAAASSATLTRESRHVVAIMDGLARGQRGQVMASMGAAMRDMGIGATGLLTGVGGFVAFMTGAAILRGAENMGKWAQETKAAADAAGMSVSQYSQLQGALTLTGMKANEADSSLRLFAEHITQALADPSSKAAQAFHALGISQSELTSHATDTLGVLKMVADANERYANSATKSAALNEILGRGFEHMLPALQGGAAGFQTLMDQARAAGLTLDDETAKSLIATQEKIIDLGVHLRGDAIQAFIAWGPAIQTVVTTLQTLSGLLTTLISDAATFSDKINTMVEKFIQLNLDVLNLIPGMSTLMKHFASAARPSAGDYSTMDIVEGGMGGGPGKAVKSFGQQASVLQDLGAKIAEARDKAATATTDYAQLAANEERAAISVIEHVLATESMSAKQRLAIEAELARSKAALRAMTMRSDVRDSKQYIQELEQAASAMDRAGQDIMRGFERRMNAMVKLREITPQQAYGFDMEEAIRQAQEQKARLDAILSSPIATAQERTRAYWQEWDLGTRLQEQLDTLGAKVTEAGQRDAEQYMRPWENAVDEVGQSIDSTIGEAIKSAFTPMKPEYWVSSLQGPHGQPLMQFHRISPTQQLLGGLGMNVAGDLGKALMSNVETSLAKSIFGSSTTSLSQGLVGSVFKGLGLGPKGGDMTSQQTFQSSVSTFQSAVQTFASTARGGASVNGTTTPTTTAPSSSTTPQTSSDARNNTTLMVGAIGAAGNLVASVVGGTAGQIINIVTSVGELLFTGLMILNAKPSILGFTYAHGGIVPSAAGGMIVGGLGSGASPAILHPREMVLPSHLSEGIQNMIGNGRGGAPGDVHMHFHGPADAPSMSRWFKENMIANSSAIRDMFKYNALTPRTL